MNTDCRTRLGLATFCVATFLLATAPVAVCMSATGRAATAVAALDRIPAADWLKLPSGALLERVISASSKESLDAAATSDPRAQALVGSAHLAGVHGYAKSETEAVRFYRLAAGSNPIAQNNLGNLLLSGAANGGKPAPSEAAEMFRRAATQGHPVAQFNLGILFANGQGVPQDVPKAIEYMTLAAAQGVAQAKSSLDGLNAQVAATRSAEEMERLQAAAAKGDADALYAIAKRTEEMDDGSEEAYSVIQSEYEAALNAYVRDANASSVHAMQRAADMFYTATGTRRDVTRAFDYYQRAAKAGDAWAQMRLGQMYQRGEFVPADPAQAIRLYQQAARQGQPDAQRKLQELGKSW